ncbi:MAG: right-handed parallel beta-helix repeat-containing protein [Pirellulales bacterium]
MTQSAFAKDVITAGPSDNLQAIVDDLKPGDILSLRPGTYDQSFVVRTQGTRMNPIQICGEGKVEFSGLKKLDVQWTEVQPGVFQAPVKHPVCQLFDGSKMMIPARWPNMTFAQRWDNSKWPHASKESVYGTMVDSRLEESGLDFSGCIAVLNIGSWQTYRRMIQKHGRGSDRFTYPTDVDSRLHHAKHPSEIDRYCIYGEAALDAPYEWFFDHGKSVLKICLPEGVQPTDLDLASKENRLAILGNDCRHLHIRGINFVATTLRLVNAHFCKLSDIEIDFGSTIADPFGQNRPLQDQHLIGWSSRHWFGESSIDALTEIIGDDNHLTNIVARHSEGPILTVSGQRNQIQNCLFEDFDWQGLDYGFGIDLLAAAPVTVRHVTLDHCGGSEGLRLPNHGKSLVEYCHLHHCGLRQSDGAIIQASGADVAGTEIHHNWIHDHQAFHWGGNGIRGDDGSRGLLIHHNVVWNCNEKAIVVKGDHHQVFHNTCFDNPKIDILLPRNRLPSKTQELEKQNIHSQAVNNWSRVTGSWSWEKPELSPLGYSENNAPAHRNFLQDPGMFDFRPRVRSASSDANSSKPQENTSAISGSKPDLGAYEYAQMPWKAGYMKGR